MQVIQLHRGKHLFLKFLNRSRTGLSVTVAVLVRDADAQPGLQMPNISRHLAQEMGWRFNPIKEGVIVQSALDKEEFGPWLTAQLARHFHDDAAAFTFEWL